MVRVTSLWLLSLGAVVAVGCSSSSNGSTSTNDGGTLTLSDGGVVSANDGGATTGDDGGGVGGGNLAACTAQIKFNQRCAQTTEGKSQACADGRTASCTQTLSTMRAEYQDAVAACTTDAVTCDDGPSTCIEGKMAGVVPTAAQLKVKDDFCATCTAVADCANAFYLIDPNNGNGPGYTVLEASDSVAQGIDTKCTGASLDMDAGGGDCVTAFITCVGDVSSSALPDDPDACFPPYTGDDASTDASGE